MRKTENQHAYFRIADQIVIIELKQNVTLDLEAAQSIAKCRMHLQAGKTYPVLLNLNGIADSQKAGRDYMSRFGWFFATRVAIVAVPFKAFAIAKFYLLVSKPCVPTAIFNTTEPAVQFLRNPL